MPINIHIYIITSLNQKIAKTVKIPEYKKLKIIQFGNVEDIYGRIYLIR